MAAITQVISVSALNAYVRSILEGDEALCDIAIEGEISGFNRHFKSGHCYFSLVDAKASVKAVMFRTSVQRLAFLPQNGMKVVARGRVSLYERDGAFQFYAEFLFPQGQGAAQLAYEQLRARLEGEGLFAPQRKRELPAWPKCIGLVTSKTGAALQDILQVAQRRCPIARFVLAPVPVQGEEAAGAIAQAITALGAGGGVDLIIVARGGGAAEDLAVFNAEAVARAAAGSAVPVISAVGHETDYTIIDFAADLRAPTPSAAAELALPNLSDRLTQMMNIWMNISDCMQFSLNSCYNSLGRCARSPALAGLRPALNARREKTARAARELRAALTANHGAAARRLRHTAGLAQSLSPYAVLSRGYAAVFAGGKALAGVCEVRAGQALDVRLRDGSLGCEVREIHEGRPVLDG